VTIQLSLGMRRLVGWITVILAGLVLAGALAGQDLMAFLLAVFA